MAGVTGDALSPHASTVPEIHVGIAVAHAAILFGRRVEPIDRRVFIRVRQCQPRCVAAKSGLALLLGKCREIIGGGKTQLALEHANFVQQPRPFFRHAGGGRAQHFATGDQQRRRQGRC